MTTESIGTTPGLVEQTVSISQRVGIGLYLEQISLARLRQRTDFDIQQMVLGKEEEKLQQFRKLPFGVKLTDKVTMKQAKAMTAPGGFNPLSWLLRGVMAKEELERIQNVQAGGLETVRETVAFLEQAGPEVWEIMKRENEKGKQVIMTACSDWSGENWENIQELADKSGWGCFELISSDPSLIGLRGVQSIRTATVHHVTGGSWDEPVYDQIKFICSGPDASIFRLYLQRYQLTKRRKNIVPASTSPGFMEQFIRGKEGQQQLLETVQDLLPNRALSQSTIDLEDHTHIGVIGPADLKNIGKAGIEGKEKFTTSLRLAQKEVFQLAYGLWWQELRGKQNIVAQIVESVNK